MSVNPESWPGLLSDYGPYAILALFVAWVVPSASKRLRQIKQTDPKSVRVAATATLCASWAVVLVMVGYILFTWPPLRVYRGQLGTLKESEQIVPLNHNVYVNIDVVSPGDRHQRQVWRFALVDEAQDLRDMQKVTFTYFWGPNGENSADFQIPTTAVLSGQTHDFAITEKEDGAVYTWRDGAWSAASDANPAEPVGFNSSWGSNAYADEISVNDLRQISDRLASPNRLVRAKARADMRTLTTQELGQLRDVTNDQTAIDQIERELQRRRH